MMAKILMIGPNPGAMGGMATVERNILAAAPSLGDEIDFISTYEEGGMAKKIGVAVKAYLKFSCLLANCEVVHIHMASRGSFRRKKAFVEKALEAQKPVVAHLHGSEFAVWFGEECSDADRLRIRRTFSRCAAVIVLSEEWRDFFLANDICREDRLHVLHNAVPIPDRPSKSYSSQDVLFLGRLDDRKNPEMLIRSSRKLLKEHQDSKLLFGGDGPIERYAEIAKKLGVFDRCEFCGWVTGEDKEELFDRAAAYCLPSKNEGMPMGVLEAMSYGIPPIATPVGGIPQIINDGLNGFIVPINDEEALSDTLCKLMDSPSLRKRIGENARRTIEERFGIDRFYEKLSGIYGLIASGDA